ncbi:hypothetical protein [Anaerococcus lactolyticus]|uniref:Cell division protein FtsL n=2 Tax=Anaerococcus lactolyticus TaxID=33032 RepID=C2BIC5_9FIRM|nr:hypothetical protein [Anaerococcus lactolyticus]EEI85295.1 hypothetical protein HMPREF0072_2095 [Anaerococcus lactolyticus ATCC 51172]KGF04316.1 hypothetical protein HMPREF1630_04705 [Anaerococcus lactolyticus S7-1-13]
MAERFEKRLVKNKNRNRVRLKVKERPKLTRANQIEKTRKRDRNVKYAISFIAFAFIATMATFLIIKRINLSNDRFEYNRLQAEIVSYELQRDRLQNNLDEAIDLNSIQRYAIEDLGMVYKKNNN